MEQYPINSCAYFREDEHYNRCKVGDSPIGLYLLDRFDDKISHGKMVMINNQIVFNKQVFIDAQLVRTNAGYYFEEYICWMLDIFDKLASHPRSSELMYVCISNNTHVIDIATYMDSLCKIPAVV